MIFGTWRSYFISSQIFENKVGCPVSKKRRRYFHFLLSLAYPIDRLDWALFSVVILFHHLFPLLEKVEHRAFILPRNFPAVFIIFTGRGGAGNPHSPHLGAGGREPPFPAGRVPRRAVRPSLEDDQVQVCSLSWIIQHKNCKYLDWCQVCLKNTIVIILIYAENRCTMKHQLYQFNDNKTFNKYISSSSLT